MPLPNLNRRCSAKARSTGYRCLNPAAFGCNTCRVHGAWSGAKARVGRAHPRYKQGWRTLESIRHYREAMAQLQQVEQVGYASGIFQGPRIRGRKTQTLQLLLLDRVKRNGKENDG